MYIPLIFLTFNPNPFSKDILYVYHLCSVNILCKSSPHFDILTITHIPLDSLVSPFLY